MQSERQVRLFRNGRNQAVRIPRDFEMEGNEAIIRKEGNRLILEPIGIKNRLLELLETLKPIQEEFPAIEDPTVNDEDIF
ncbi:MAG: AbrB/MazE/SpoVT family DNA-binding domain-containing protein [bacterium]|nr:AbrB/MazE/SpoVT family DNA-binding domain-containing protein [bacterium]